MTGKVEKVELAMDKVGAIEREAVKFKDSLAKRLSDMNVQMKDWRFGMESSEEGVTIDVTVKVLLNPKRK
jgi:hypothetical protein